MKFHSSESGYHLRPTVLRFLFTVFLSLLAAKATAFSLLGPYADWMQTTNGYRLPGDIGGPMDIKEGYRWNVPILTYGFDQSFLAYFGSNGVAAVEQAIQILNDLPAASKIVLTNYPLDSRQVNPTANGLGLFDLKSATLALLLEQMGLGQPSRNAFDLKQWDPMFSGCLNFACWYTWAIPTNIILRNFDPETRQADYYVNGVLYTGSLLTLPFGYSGPPFVPVTDVVEYTVDPLATGYGAVADGVFSFNWPNGGLSSGTRFTGLTRDDVGGLGYLLANTNVNFEGLLPDVHRLDSQKPPKVNLAARPGVEKVMFVKQPFDTRKSQWKNLTYRYTAAYITNGVVKKQQIRRIVTQPDFLFTATDTGENNFYTLYVLRTGTTNWIDNAVLNGGTAGPGVIQPPITISFHKLGPTVYTGDDPSVALQGWGSFAGTADSPVIYPSAPQQTNNVLTVRLRFRNSDSLPFLPVTNVTWHLSCRSAGPPLCKSRPTRQTGFH